MKSIYLFLVLTISISVFSCGESVSANQSSTDTTVPSTTQEHKPAPSTEAPPSTPKVTHSPETYTKEQRQIDAAVDKVNNNIGSYNKEETTVQYQGATYAVIKYKDKSGFVVKSEAIGGTRNWEFFALPNATSNKQLIYSAYYQKTDDPNNPSTRSIYHIGALTNLEPKSRLFIDQDGNTIKGEELQKDEAEYKDALKQFFD